MRTLVFIGILILGIIFWGTIFHINIFKVLNEILRAFTRGAANGSKEYHEDTHQQFERMTLDQKRKSKKYKYYCFMNEMLDTFQFKERGVTVEGITIGLIAIWVAIGVLLGILTSNVAFIILLPILAFPTTIAGMFLASRVGVRRRKQMFLDSMDILCAVMSDGFLKAVKSSMLQFPEEVRPYFDRFVKNVELLNISLPDAVRQLNREIGSLYDEFCDTVITYEANHALGMETLFNFYIEENAKTLERDRAIKRMSDAVNLDYFASLGVIVLFGAVTTLLLTGGPGLWAKPIGLFIGVLILIGAVGVFIFIQYLLSKAYVYTERR